MKIPRIDFDKRIVHIMMLGLLFTCCFTLGRGARIAVEANAANANNDRLVIAIDAGHGGVDPGKTMGEILEKDINLEIALLIREILLEKDIEVVLTREDDKGLYDENASNKKQSDMKNRCELINSEGADLLISIHQNSYSSKSVKGAQVFYYENSTEGEKLAKSIQNSIKDMVDKDNKRQAKSNNSYYVLINASMPAVIVECGFITNDEEREKLISKDYQKDMANAIVSGILQYIE